MKQKPQNHSKFRQLGQGMTEYIIIVALVAVAGISTYKIFGETIRHQVAGLADEVAGKANVGKAAATASAGRADTDAGQNKDMDNYDANNQ